MREVTRDEPPGAEADGALRLLPLRHLANEGVMALPSTRFVTSRDLHRSRSPPAHVIRRRPWWIVQPRSMRLWQRECEAPAPAGPGAVCRVTEQTGEQAGEIESVKDLPNNVPGDAGYRGVDWLVNSCAAAGTAQGSPRETAGHHASEQSFSPTIPAKIRRMQRRRRALRDSSKSTSPAMTVPTAPIPVQTA